MGRCSIPARAAQHEDRVRINCIPHCPGSAAWPRHTLHRAPLLLLRQHQTPQVPGGGQGGSHHGMAWPVERRSPVGRRSLPAERWVVARWHIEVGGHSLRSITHWSETLEPTRSARKVRKPFARIGWSVSCPPTKIYLEYMARSVSTIFGSRVVADVHLACGAAIFAYLSGCGNSFVVYREGGGNDLHEFAPGLHRRKHRSPWLS